VILSGGGIFQAVDVRNQQILKAVLDIFSVPQPIPPTVSFRG
jgi:hypothetical protein